MNMLQRLYYFFGPYTDKSERHVGKFFASVTEKQSPHSLEKRLVSLIQHDLAQVNLWTERQYKGYHYLTKRERRRLYENLQAIHDDFQAFISTQHSSLDEVLSRIRRTGADTVRVRDFSDQLMYIAAIQAYLSPARGRYLYRASSSFGRLLRDPRQEILEGDCNQIVTLYISLYALRYPVTDLQLMVYPGHVALHFQGVDIETTNGTFAHYASRKDVTYVPIHEIVSINLLDTTDTNFQRSLVNPEVLLQSARLAYVVSSHRQIVKKNLETAYQQTVQSLLRNQDYKKALTYARQSSSFELLELVSHNGAVFYIHQHDYQKARNFAHYSSKKQQLGRSIDQSEAAYLYNAHRYGEALKVYERLGDRDMTKQTYRALYVEAQTQLRGVKTVDQLKPHAGTIRTMERYAKASGDSELLRHVQSLVKHL